MDTPKSLEVLGVNYKVDTLTAKEEPRLKKADGLCDTSTKDIVLNNIEPDEDTLADLETYKRKVLRHELTHALLYESGLDCETWARNEEIIDWIALQFPKMAKLFKAAGCEN